MSHQNSVVNEGEIGNQVNAGHIDQVNLAPLSRLAQRFKKLKDQVANQDTVEGFLEDFKYYNTELDGVSMPEKLRDGGFNEIEIGKATLRKHKYRKKLEMNRFYETAQLIDMELLAMINHNFETYVEPLIFKGEITSEIKKVVKEKVIDPICQLLNEHGTYDDFLNYTIDDIYGMMFFLTGKCHLNWKKYDNL